MNMQLERPISISVRVAACTALLFATGTTTTATEPCGDFGECKAFIEINATDGDIGFHFLMDGDDLNSGGIDDPNGARVFQEMAKGPLREQKITETFSESAEPLCWPDPEAEPDDEIVTLEEFLDRWTAGTYVFSGKGDGGEKSIGETELTHELPAAPANIAFDGSVITWGAGDDLGRCASSADLSDLVASNVLPVHPENVTVAAWEIVLEPDVEDGDPTGNLVFTVRVSGDVQTTAVTVPADYLASLPDDTPVKIEVGAIGVNDNATFAEVDGFCVNDNEGCD
jgi:hypothetical protein